MSRWVCFANSGLESTELKQPTSPKQPFRTELQNPYPKCFPWVYHMESWDFLIPIFKTNWRQCPHETSGSDVVKNGCNIYLFLKHFHAEWYFANIKLDVLEAEFEDWTSNGTGKFSIQIQTQNTVVKMFGQIFSFGLEDIYLVFSEEILI